MTNNKLCIRVNCNTPLKKVDLVSNLITDAYICPKCNDAYKIDTTIGQLVKVSPLIMAAVYGSILLDGIFDQLN